MTINATVYSLGFIHSNLILRTNVKIAIPNCEMEPNMNPDLSIKMQSGRFNYRVGAIIQHENHLLMAKNAGDNFYYTIGGRVKFGESVEDTILRETYEETGLPLEIDRLAFFHENFFTYTSTQEQFHELCLFFLMKPCDGLSQIRQSFNEDYGEVSIHWLPINNLHEYELFPQFFKTAQLDMPYIQHIVTRDL